MSYPNIPPASTLPEKATATVEFGIVACALRYWTQALDFQGRATRRDILVAMVMNLSAFTILSAVSLFLANVFWFITIIPNLSQFCRRCHDVGKSPFPLIGVVALLLMAMVLSGCFAILPGIALAVFLLYICWLVLICPGDPYANDYGPDPRA